MKKKHLILILIILIGFGIRLYRLGDNGIGFFRDEAALGFNSWSILKTGADEYGQKLPIFLRSFEVFFLPAYVYLSVPVFAIFGLTIFATRFLSFASGTFLIYIGYLIAKEIFKKEEAALFSSFVLAISPWAIFYSKGAFEGNLALLFFSIGFYFWLKFSRLKKQKLFFVSILFFVFSMYTYQAPRFVAPLFIAASILFSKNWLMRWKLWFSGLIFAMVLYLPILTLFFSPSSYHRAIGVSIFSDVSGTPGYISNLGSFQNFYLIPRQLTSLYLHYFSPSNLFWFGDYNPQRIVQGFSVFYIWQLPFLFIGLYKLIRRKSVDIKPLLVLSFIAPIPAALTKDSFHTYRSLILFLPISLFIGYGIYVFFKKRTQLAKVFMTFIITFYLLWYMVNFHKLTAVRHWQDWDYGYKEISEFIKTQPKNLRVVIDNTRTQSYIHFLFHGLVSVTDYQEISSGLVGNGKYYSSPDVLRPKVVGRFEFREVDWPKERGDKNTLFIFPADRLYPSEFSGDPKLELVKTIYATGDQSAFYIIKSK
ncbi:hypothetical protein A2771_03160 [Candidatus Woesebacteria bacterium RIFCSPHIGHO2_01_FULL_38_26b]|uniref:Glycosyltransferase RgtA/B/C/D-like domain-containing protein n=1 Tax=Candidatus Woesebacteria bacterium RIFCSPHIGHO2_01_FULL_38_26b TaxID=1802491 RepID=A0A1F7Y304_9BACT|nr:MAG: hypothetical protein A2771_03160 [Candidatus Woesebacteria bacterium RIFCSPHIGHO2_01_FULL_38_26b]